MATAQQYGPANGPANVRHQCGMYNDMLIVEIPLSGILKANKSHVLFELGCYLRKFQTLIFVLLNIWTM